MTECDIVCTLAWPGDSGELHHHEEPVLTVLRAECNKTYNHPGQVHKIDPGDTTSTFNRAAASCSAKFLTLLAPAPQSGQSKKFPGTTRLLSFVQFSEVHWILLSVNQVDRHRRVKMFHDTNKLYFEIHFWKIVAWDEKKTPKWRDKKRPFANFSLSNFLLNCFKVNLSDNILSNEGFVKFSAWFRNNKKGPFTNEQKF